MPSVKAVTFDLWQTLLIDIREKGLARTRIRIQATHESLQQAGHDFAEEHILEAYRRCYRTCRYIRASGRDVSFDKQIQIFVKNIKSGLLEQMTKVTFDQIAKRYADSFFEHPPTLHPEAKQLLRNVYDRGYKIGLISNTGMTPGVIFRSYMDHLNILHYFDSLTFSDEVQLAKPAPKIFHITLCDLSAEPEEAVHVGDHLLNDVVGSKAIGAQAVWIKGFDNGDIVIKPDAIVSNLGEVITVLDSLA